MKPSKNKKPLSDKSNFTGKRPDTKNKTIKTHKKSVRNSVEYNRRPKEEECHKRNNDYRGSYKEFRINSDVQIKAGESTKPTMIEKAVQTVPTATVHIDRLLAARYPKKLSKCFDMDKKRETLEPSPRSSTEVAPLESESSCSDISLQTYGPHESSYFDNMKPIVFQTNEGSTNSDHLAFTFKFMTLSELDTSYECSLRRIADQLHEFCDDTAASRKTDS